MLRVGGRKGGAAVVEARVSLDVESAATTCMHTSVSRTQLAHQVSRPAFSRDFAGEMPLLGPRSLRR